MSKELKAWFTVDELNAWAEKKLKENPQWAEQPAQQDIPDLIAGALGVSRGTAYDMMREALAEQPAQQHQEPFATVYSFNDLGGVYELVSPPKYRPPVGTKLYTSPPAQRTWVGLTNKERADCWETIPELAMRKVEAKLKEKNT
jgi:hypothetical protein